MKKAKNILKLSYSKGLRKKNAVKKLFKKRDLKYLYLGRRKSIVEGPARTKKGKKHHIKGREKKKKDNNIIQKKRGFVLYFIKF